MQIKPSLKLIVAIIAFVLFFTLIICTPIGSWEYFFPTLGFIAIIIALYCFIDLIQSLRKLVKLKEREIQNKIGEDKKD